MWEGVSKMLKGRPNVAISLWESVSSAVSLWEGVSMMSKVKNNMAISLWKSVSTAVSLWDCISVMFRLKLTWLLACGRVLALLLPMLPLFQSIRDANCLTQPLEILTVVSIIF